MTNDPVAAACVTGREAIVPQTGSLSNLSLLRFGRLFRQEIPSIVDGFVRVS